MLLLCFLGRCCVIPVVHATNFEINNRAYAARMDKNALCQKRIVHGKFEEVVKESFAIKERSKGKRGSKRDMESAYTSIVAKTAAKEAGEPVGGSVSSDPGGNASESQAAQSDAGASGKGSLKPYDYSKKKKKKDRDSSKRRNKDQSDVSIAASGVRGRKSGT